MDFGIEHNDTDNTLEGEDDQHYTLQEAVKGGPETVPVMNILTNTQLSPSAGQEWRVRCRCKMM